MKENIVSSRYANALFAVAKDIKELDSILGDLQNFNFFMYSHKIKPMLINPLVNKADKYQMVESFKERFSSKHSEHFFKFIIRKNRIALLDLMIDSFSRKLLEKKNITKVKIKVVDIPDAEEMKLIEAKVKEYFKSEVLFDIEVDKSIIGGFVAYSSNMLLDFSLKNQLLKLDHNINRIKI